MTTGEAPVLPWFLRRLVLLPEARHVRHDEIHGALALNFSFQLCFQGNISPTT